MGCLALFVGAFCPLWALVKTSKVFLGGSCTRHNTYFRNSTPYYKQLFLEHSEPSSFVCKQQHPHISKPRAQQPSTVPQTTPNSPALPVAQHRSCTPPGWLGFIPSGVFSSSTRWRCAVALQLVDTDGSEAPSCCLPGPTAVAAPAAWLCLCGAAARGLLPTQPCPAHSPLPLSSTVMPPSPLIMPPPPPRPFPAACRPQNVMHY